MFVTAEVLASIALGFFLVWLLVRISVSAEDLRYWGGKLSEVRKAQEEELKELEYTKKKVAELEERRDELAQTVAGKADALARAKGELRVVLANRDAAEAALRAQGERFTRLQSIESEEKRLAADRAEWDAAVEGREKKLSELEEHISRLQPRLEKLVAEVAEKMEYALVAGRYRSK